MCIRDSSWSDANSSSRGSKAWDGVTRTRTGSCVSASPTRIASASSSSSGCSLRPLMSWKRAFRRSPISELISSRTCRAFSRAPLMHFTIEKAPSESATKKNRGRCGSRCSRPRRRRGRKRRETNALPWRTLPDSESGRASSSAHARHCPPSRNSGSSSRLSATRDGMAFWSPNSSNSQFCKTHVSFDPPPCELFTTSDPLRKATRVSPPGMIVIFSPLRMYGRRSMWRPSIAPSQ